MTGVLIPGELLLDVNRVDRELRRIGPFGEIDPRQEPEDQIPELEFGLDDLQEVFLQPVTLQYIDLNDNLQIVDVPPPALLPIENFLPGGEVASETVPEPLVLPIEPKRGELLRFFRGTTLIDEYPLAQIYSTTDLYRSNPFAEARPRIFALNPQKIDHPIDFPVFSERFVDEQRFYKFVEGLFDFILRFEPFSTAADQIRLRAFYAEAPDTISGHFNTSDKANLCDSPTTQATYGNNALAAQWLRGLMYKGKFGLVLFDSEIRGGAGGLEQYSYPAWASTASCDGEHWEAIALHEIGHALGLADEYVLRAREKESARDEPNITDQPDTLANPNSIWSFEVDGKPRHYVPVTDHGNPTSDHRHGTWDSDTVGTFRGARYRNDLFRSSPNCLMRNTTVPYFCKVCRDYIEKVIT
jgi:hypothetical protein